jgi:hypothetical protein
VLSGCYIYTNTDFVREPSRWAKAYVPYLIIFVTGYWTQLTLYWILGTYSSEIEVASRAGGVFRAFETAGQAVSYGLSSAKRIDHVIPLYINCAALALVIPSMVLLISKMPTVPVRLVYSNHTYSGKDHVTKKN